MALFSMIRIVVVHDTTGGVDSEQLNVQAPTT